MLISVYSLMSTSYQEEFLKRKESEKIKILSLGYILHFYHEKIFNI